MVVTIQTGPGRQTTKPVHVFVALAFLGPRPEGLEVCHNDSNKLNNAPQNLRYGTRLSNASDMVDAGHSSRGARNRVVVFTEDQVREIRAVYAAGERSYKAIAERFGTTAQNIYHIVRRDSWKWLA